MTKENKKILSDLFDKDIRARYPNFPYPPPAKYTDKTANGLTKCIIDFLNFMEHQAERISSMGRVIDNSKMVTDVVGITRKIGSTKYIPPTTTKGTADISATIFGKSVKIEVKIGKDRQSADQKRYQQMVTKSGGVYFIAKNFDDFITEYKRIVSDLKKVHLSPLGREFVLFGTNEIMYLDNLEKKTLPQNVINNYK